jgi:hypothetical protein
MKHVTPAARHLLDIGRALVCPDKPSAHDFNLPASLRAVKTELADLKLNQTEIKLIAVVFHNNIEGEKVMTALEVLAKVFPKAVDRLAHLDRMRRLVLLKVLEPCEKSYRRRAESGKIEMRLDRLHILDMGVRLHAKFLARLLGEKNLDPEAVDTPFKDNREYLEDWFSYVEAIRDYRSSRQYGDEEAAMRSLAQVDQWERRLETRLLRSTEDFPFKAMIEEYNLDRKEQIIILYLLKEELRGESCSRSELLEIISEDRFDGYHNAKYFDKTSVLVRQGLVEIHENMSFVRMGRELNLASDVPPRILRSAAITDAERVTEIIRSGDTFSLVKPHVGLDRLILPTAVKGMLETSITQCRQEVGRTLRDWGLDQGMYMKSGPEARDYKPAMLLLFSGPPGTGKTFAAGAVALSLGKDLLVTDISRILSCWVGESEANVRQLFAQYEQIVRRTENPPVLLLNECDQFLTARGKADHSADRMYNQMQNLFLEAFERLQGVLIATTNLRDNLDPAFSRRFNLKLEFPVPDAEARARLWENHLTASIPRANDVDLNALANQFVLTGGQISVVVKNAAVEAAGMPTDSRMVTQELLGKYARLEAQTSFGDGKANRIGFGN